MKKQSPTQEQIEKVDEIAKTLGIDFPQSSKDFTFKKYKKFISRYQHEYELWCENASLIKEKI